MADFLFINNSDTGNLSLWSNWDNADSSGGDTGSQSGTSVTPGPGDTAWFSTGNVPATGVLTCANLGAVSAVAFSGGTYNILNPVVLGNLILNSTAILGGTWNCLLSDGSYCDLQISGGFFNQLVSLSFADSSVTAGNFTDLTVTPAFGSTLYSSFTPTSISGTFTNSIDNPISVAGNVVTGRMTLDGSTYFYSSSSTYAAPANKVLTGTNNLGVAGNVVLPAASKVVAPTAFGSNGATLGTAAPRLRGRSF